MIDSQLSLWKSVLYRSLSMGVMTSLLISSVAFANPVADPSKQSVPVQLKLIRETLAEMEGRLTTRLSDIQTGITANSTALSTHDTDIKGRLNKVDLDNGLALAALEALSGQLDIGFTELLESVNSVEVTTEICMSAEFVAEFGISEHGEAGVGWPNVLDAKLIIQEDAGLKVGSGLNQDFCIQIPLYSTFVEGQLTITPDAQEQLDDLITFVSQPAMDAVTFYAFIYDQILPAPSDVTGVLQELLDAALPGGDPAIMIDPLTYYPLIPPLMEEAIVVAPLIVQAAIADPCGTIKGLDVLNVATGAEFDLVCSLAADATFEALQVITAVVKILVCIATAGFYCPE